MTVTVNCHHLTFDSQRLDSPPNLPEDLLTRLARFSLRHRTVTLLIVALLIGFGSYSVAQLNQELFPSLEIPNLIVTGTLPGAGPNEIAEDVAAPIEGVFLATDNLEHVQSTSLEGFVIVSGSYEFGTDMDAVQSDVREQIAALRLPEGADTDIQRISLDAFPIYSVAVSGPDAVAIEEFVTTSLVPAIDRVGSVANVNVAGGNNEVVSVTLDPEAMSQAGITTGNVISALGAADISVPVGSVSADGFQLPARVVSGVEGIEGLEQVPVQGMVPGGAPIPLSQISTVTIVENGLGSTISRLDGQPAMTVEVIRAQGENTVDTVNEVTAAIEEVEVPEGITVTEVINQAPEIQNSVSEMTRDAVIGGILAILMILIFLRSIRGTVVSGVSIPLSLLVAFILMNLEGITLNILTLGALSVAIGRVIDDAIVVLENIHRLLDEGYQRSEAVLKGTEQMVPAITASTITTVAVFLPLAFIGGLIGEVFVGFALTVTFALLASLIVAVTVVPVLAITLLKRSHRPAGRVEGRRGGARCGRHRPPSRVSPTAGLGPQPSLDGRVGLLRAARLLICLPGHRAGDSVPVRRGHLDAGQPDRCPGHQPHLDVGPGGRRRGRPRRGRGRGAGGHGRRLIGRQPVAALTGGGGGTAVRPSPSMSRRAQISMR